jgi:hypothetical protein
MSSSAEFSASRLVVIGVKSYSMMSVFTMYRLIWGFSQSF